MFSVKFKEMFGPSYIILRIQRQRANSVDLDEVAHHEPPHQDLCRLHIQLFWFQVLSADTMKHQTGDFFLPFTPSKLMLWPLVTNVVNCSH